MEFTFETSYNQKALTVMARGLRKTVRKKRSRRSHILGSILIVLAVVLVISSGTFDFRAAVTLLAALIILLALFFEDWLNGYFARKRMIPGSDQAFSRFSDGSYSSETEIGTTEFHYHPIVALAETDRYFVFLLSNNHAQVYDKHAISGGSPEEFVSFIQNKTGKTMIRV